MKTAFLESGMVDPAFPIRLLMNGPSFDFGYHWHEEVELVLVENGKAPIGINHQIYEMEEGDLLVIRPGDIHCFLPGSGSVYIVQFKFSALEGSLAEAEDLRALKGLFSASRIVRLSEVLPARVRIRRAIRAMLEEDRARRPGYRWAIKARLLELAVRLLRLPATAAGPHPGCLPWTKKLEVLEKVFRYIEEHYHENIRLVDAAEAVKFNKYYLCKCFKETTGMTFLDYLNNYRIMRAEWALLHTRDPILQIAVRHGFNNLNTFNRVFKKCKGCTPSDFRKKHSLEGR